MVSNMVATLTFHRAVSYGAVLQAYALQKTLKDEGIETEILDYRCKFIEDLYYGRPKSIRKIAKQMVRLPWNLLKRRRFTSFMSEMLDMSDAVQKDELSLFSRKYSKIIVGSDQVWNTDLTGFDESYFLDFVDDPSARVAYAASIGTEKWGPNEEKRCLSLVQGISNLSVRESTASGYLCGLMGKEVPVVCDPTLLVGRETWQTIGSQMLRKTPYLLIYSLGRVGKGCLDWSLKYAKKNGLKVVAVHDSAIPCPKVKNIIDAGPREFVGLIAGSTMVVTDSFHGICLSIVMERQFVWFRDDEAGGVLSQRSSRIRDLLDCLSLESRVVRRGDPYPDTIDYSQVDSELDSMVRNSRKFLLGAIRSSSTG